MSAVDQAFIRAYASDSKQRTPAPHIPLQSLNSPAPREVALRLAPDDAGSHSHGSDNLEVARVQPSEAPDVDVAVDDVRRSERRPLSAWSPNSSVAASFQPALEVDHYGYGDVVHRLISEEGSEEERVAQAERTSPWSEVVQTLMHAVDQGQSLIGIGGADAECGCTTVLICLGRLLAAHGLRVALVDGDFRTAQLAAEMGLAIEIGWEDVLAGRVPLAESVITSLDEQIALLPLTQGGQPASEKLDTVHASVTAGVLRYHYDVVLFDLGSLSVTAQAATAQRLARQCRLDAVVLVSHAANEFRGGLSRLDELAPELSEIYLGDIVNFFAMTTSND